MFRKANKYIILMAIIFMFSATGAFAEDELLPTDPPDSCICGDSIIGIVTDAEGNFPVESTCGLDSDGEPIPCWIYEYTYDSGNGWSAAAQTVPGKGNPVAFEFYENYSFSSIDHYQPPIGTDISKVSFGQNIHERGVIDYTSVPQGGDTLPKFGYASNYSGVGWTSLFILKGKNQSNCAIAGPAYVEDVPPPYIQRTTVWKLFGDVKVELEIDYKSCTYVALDENGDPYEQFPEENITITVDNLSGPVEHHNSPGKCDEYAYSYGEGTCSVYNLGGYYIKIPKNCKP